MKHLQLLSASVLTLALASPVLAQEDCGVSATVQLTLPTCGEFSNGEVLINAVGGTGTYTYFLNGLEVAGPNVTGLVAGWYTYDVVDDAKCWFKSEFTLECEPEKVDCNFRTQTMGGWGAKPHGNNPAAYLQGHFASCFPNGVTIGCANGNTLTLTTSNAVMNFLPSTSTAGQLPNDMVNPGGSYSNVLAGQLVAAVINATVDACDPNFGSSDGYVGDATYVGGTFAGWSVAEVIAAANQFIGGCGGSYSAAQFNVALTDFNENYDNGTTNNGDLECGGKKSLDVTTGSNSLSAYPNPATESVTVQANFSAPGTGTLVVMDVTGRVVKQVRIQAEVAGARSVTLELDELNAGTYSLVLQTSAGATSTKVVVSK